MVRGLVWVLRLLWVVLYRAQDWDREKLCGLDIGMVCLQVQGGCLRLLELVLWPLPCSVVGLLPVLFSWPLPLASSFELPLVFYQVLACLHCLSGRRQLFS